VAGAPVQLIYVADYEQMSFSMKDKDKMAHAFSDAAFISQNVYLYCASAGLATGVRSTVDRDALAKKMKLRKMQRITLVQAVGYPPDK
jgi:nitroreductase